MKSTLALLLTIFCALTAHISTYLDPGAMKYLLTGIGSISAICGGIILFKLRKPFVREYRQNDWGTDENPNALLISKRSHKKENPIVQFEIFDFTNNTWNPAEPSVVNLPNGDILISVGNLDSPSFRKVRVTIK